MIAAASHSATAGTRDMTAATRHGTATPRRHPMTHPNMSSATVRGTPTP